MEKDLKNKLKSDGVLEETEESRGLKTISVKSPMCGGKDSLEVIYKTADDKLVFDILDLITTKIGVKLDITATRKGGGG